MPDFLKLVVVLALVAVAIDSSANTCYSDLTHSQKRVLQEAYDMGSPHDLGYTMMAIAMAESGAGKYRLNLNTMDFGVMQNSLKTAASRTNTKGYYGRMLLAERLIKEDHLSMKLALEELQYWGKRLGNWRDSVRAYNAGNNYKGKQEYLNKIVPLVKKYQACGQPLNIPLLYRR